MKFFMKNILFFFFFLLVLPIFPASIIIEVDVLIREIRSRVIWDIGPTKLIGFHNPANIAKDYFLALEKILPQNPLFPTVVKGDLLLPQIIKNWLCGIQSEDIIRQYAVQELKKLHQTQGTSTSLYQAIAEHVFTPSRYAHVREGEKEGLKILQKIYDQKDAQGNHKHKIFGLSNQNAKSYEKLCENKVINAGIKLLNKDIISGTAGNLKPDPAFFEYALKEFMIPDNELIIYIDDEITFLAPFALAAKNLGKKNVHCIHCKDFNFKPVIQELKNLGIYI